VSEARVLIVVPTMGTRIRYLDRCLASVRSQSVPADITIVAPDLPEVRELADRHGAGFLVDPGSQTKAINVGIDHAAPHHEFVNWLGDDDLLEPGSLEATTSALDRQPDAVVAYGACRYIDEDDAELWISRAGPWATRILAWGPDLIPQPGMLVRTDAWRKVGGVDESYRFAFDLDLLLKLKAIGHLVDVGQVVSSFRWHADSLTVGDRTTNLQESERAKRAALGPTGRRLAWLWEGPVRVATRVAAHEVNRRARRIQAKAGA
jgi:GT2 family glycosyltransferase